MGTVAQSLALVAANLADNTSNDITAQLHRDVLNDILALSRRHFSVVDIADGQTGVPLEIQALVTDIIESYHTVAAIKPSGETEIWNWDGVTWTLKTTLSNGGGSGTSNAILSTNRGGTTEDVAPTAVEHPSPTNNDLHFVLLDGITEIWGYQGGAWVKYSSMPRSRQKLQEVFDYTFDEDTLVEVNHDIYFFRVETGEIFIGMNNSSPNGSLRIGSDTVLVFNKGTFGDAEIISLVPSSGEPNFAGIVDNSDYSANYRPFSHVHRQWVEQYVAANGGPLPVLATVSANTTATLDSELPVDCTGGTVTITAPTGVVGSVFAVFDAFAASETNNITVDFPTQFLNGSIGTDLINDNGGYAKYRYIDATIGWRREK